MRPWLVTMLLVTAGTGEARAEIVDDGSFCGTLHQLVAAAQERPAFTSLGRDGPARAARRLGFETCTVLPGLYGNRLSCRRLSNPAYPTGPATAWRVTRCLPEALRMSEPGGSRLARFRFGTLALHVDRGAVDTVLTLFALPIER